MKPTGKNRSTPRRGFAAVGLLIVLVIMLILGYRQYGAYQGGGAASGKHATQKAHKAACDLNRQSSLINLLSWQSTHPGKPISIEQLREEKVQIAKCPAGGKWTISPDGTTIYCSLHNPAPDQERKVAPVQ